MRATATVFLALATVLTASAEWQPGKAPLMTRWARDVSPDNVHPEYPRPQLVRKEWQNLNGLWDYAVTAKDAPQPAKWDGQILVPFPIEAPLSGVMKRVYETNRIWYRRTFSVSKKWLGRRLFLNFGAVDFEATVWVNGTQVGTHRGGYDAFSLDITSALKRKTEQEIVVAVWDPSDSGTQPRGKQVHEPKGARYTPSSGIWQTVWLEPADGAGIMRLKLVPDLDAKVLRVTAGGFKAEGRFVVVATVFADGKKISVAEGNRGGEFQVPIPEPRLWSPESPFLYELEIVMKRGGAIIDEVKSYFAMRKVTLGKDEKGFTRILLNNKPLFQYGLLDQGFWPDGLHTPPTDEAFRYDIEMTKRLGFNLARKHVKIEPERWYYWCDKLGLLVWQDMPNGDRDIGRKDPDIERTEESAKQFEQELKALIDGRGNHPCIVSWVLFNEGWGQFDTKRLTHWTKDYDPSRLVISASGWVDRGVGDVNNVHKYPGPLAPIPEENRAGVLGEFGGLGFTVEGHSLQNPRNWGYRSYTNVAALTTAYLNLLDNLRPLIQTNGLSAAIYTQTSDVEIEVNGMMTYDRALLKMDEATISKANKALYDAASRDAAKPGK